MTEQAEAPNPFERVARLEKATALANELEAWCEAVIQADDVAAAVANLDRDARLEAARLAGVNAPSDATWEVVVELLRDRRAARAGPKRNHPMGHGPCDWLCGTRATITLKCADGLWYRSCGKCYAKLNTNAHVTFARTIQGG